MQQMNHNDYSSSDDDNTNQLNNLSNLNNNNNNNNILAAQMQQFQQHQQLQQLHGMSMPQQNMIKQKKRKNNNDSSGKKKHKCCDLSGFTKWAIIARYYEDINPKSERLYTGQLDEICSAFGVSKRTVQRIVYDYRVQVEKGVQVPDLTNKKKGRHSDTTLIPELLDNIKRLKAKQKNGQKLTIRKMAEAYEQEYNQKISYMTLYRYEKKTQEMTDAKTKAKETQRLAKATMEQANVPGAPVSLSAAEAAALGVMGMQGNHSGFAGYSNQQQSDQSMDPALLQAGMIQQQQQSLMLDGSNASDIFALQQQQYSQQYQHEQLQQQYQQLQQQL